MGRRRRKRERRMSAKARAVLLFVMIVVAGVSIGLLFTPVFHVEEVYCVGNERISQEEVLAAAEVPLGKNILLQRLSKIRERVAEIPMVEEVKTRRIFPNKIKIWIRERVPAAYLYDGEGKCVVVDVEGKILEIIEDERVAQLKEFYTPVKAEPESKKEEAKEEDKEKKTSEPTETPTPTESPTPTETPAPTEAVEPERPYTVPFVVGLTLNKPEVGKTADSKEREKLSKVMEAFGALEKAELLVRATYMDVTDLTDAVLVIENRLEVQLGELTNMEYRSQFLATVIREKISATEEVIMDYRTNDIYVRPPEDGKERMIPKPTETPEPTEETEEE